MLKHQTIRITMFVLAAATGVLLVACGGGQPAAPVAEEVVEEVVAEEPTEEPTAEPSPEAEVVTEEVEEEPEAETPAAVGATPQEALAANLLPVAGDEEIVAATLYLMLNVPFDDGDALVFHFEDAMSGVSIGCTGYTLVVQDAEVWQVADLAVFCGRPTGPGAPVSVFVYETPDGGVAVFGEIYDAAVANVVVVAGDEETPPAQGGGAYLARLPQAEIFAISAHALDADGEVFFEGAPPPSSP